MDAWTRKDRLELPKARRQWWKKKRFAVPGWSLVAITGLAVAGNLMPDVPNETSLPMAERPTSTQTATATPSPAATPSPDQVGYPEAYRTPSGTSASSAEDESEALVTDGYEDVTDQVRRAMADADVGDSHKVYMALRDEELLGVRTDMYSVEESGYQELCWSLETCEAVARSAIADGLAVAIMDFDGEMHSFSLDVDSASRECWLYE